MRHHTCSFAVIPTASHPTPENGLAPELAGWLQADQELAAAWQEVDTLRVLAVFLGGLGIKDAEEIG